MKYYLGAYASSPNVVSWDAKLETQYYDHLKTLSNIEGLEHPFVGQLHAHDESWFLNNIDPQWSFIFTCIPGIMAAKSNNPSFGIASDDESGRAEAIDFLSKARQAIETLNTHSKRQAVRAIQIQTSPSKNAASSSATSLKKSLEEISLWDWQGAKIVIEHCDAYVDGQKPAKGFLSLEEEIEAIQACTNKNMGIVINWGRSAIETRSASGVLDHIKIAKEKGVLSGLMFSGASDKESDFGMWSDSHMPPATSEQVTLGEKTSLMSEEQIHHCLQAADAKALDIVGVKIGIRPRDTSAQQRVEYNIQALAILDRFFN